MIRDRSDPGFTLIELMIVVAIIAIIAAVAIPSLQNARKAGVEAAVVSMARTLVTVNEQYRVRHGVYMPDATTLTLEIPQLGPTLNEYDSTYYPGTSNWSIVAFPRERGVSGDRSYYVDHTGVIRSTESLLATAQARRFSNLASGQCSPV